MFPFGLVSPKQEAHRGHLYWWKVKLFISQVLYLPLGSKCESKADAEVFLSVSFCFFLTLGILKLWDFIVTKPVIWAPARLLSRGISVSECSRKGDFLHTVHLPWGLYLTRLVLQKIKIKIKIWMSPSQVLGIKESIIRNTLPVTALWSEDTDLSIYWHLFWTLIYK